MPLRPAELGDGVGAWFSGRDVDAAPVPIGGGGNLAHRRPHRPSELAAARRAVGSATETDPRTWHLLQQVHGGAVAVVDDRTPAGAELRGVDAAVTTCVERPLVVQAADCVPVLFAGPGAVGVAHAGRLGVTAGVIAAAVAALRRLLGSTAPIRAAVGPAIGPCCYEVPAALRDEVVASLAADGPAGIADAARIAGRTRWSTPSLDLPTAVRAQLGAAGVQVTAPTAECTCCDEAWFSHRRDPDSGRQIGLIVRRADAGVSP
ncbi:MAG: laccase domain-containing protein [Nitriliruptoraceae bacterium]